MTAKKIEAIIAIYEDDLLTERERLYDQDVWDQKAITKVEAKLTALHVLSHRIAKAEFEAGSKREDV